MILTQGRDTVFIQWSLTLCRQYLQKVNKVLTYYPFILALKTVTVLIYVIRSIWTSKH